MNPVLALIITNIIWGAAAPIFKFSLENIPPFILAFIRFSAASLIFLPFAYKHWQPITKKDFAEIFLIGFFSVGLNISFLFLGLLRAESINASIIGTAAPVFLYFISIFLLKEKPKAKIFTGMLVALIGVLVVILSPLLLDGKKLHIGEVEGNIFFVLCTIAGFIMHPLIGRDVLRRVNPYFATYLSFIVGSLFFLPFAIHEFQGWSFTELNIKGWVGIIYGTFFSSAVAYFFYNYGVAKIKSQEVGLFNYIDPVSSVIIAAPLLHEYPDKYFFIGALLVFGGIFIAENRLHWHPIHKIKSHDHHFN